MKGYNLHPWKSYKSATVLCHPAANAQRAQKAIPFQSSTGRIQSAALIWLIVVCTWFYIQPAEYLPPMESGNKANNKSTEICVEY